jgi:uncharacterized membrane-anchored protein
MLHRTSEDKCKFHREPQKKKNTQVQKAICSKLSKSEGITAPEVKACYKTIVIKTGWCWHKYRHRDHGTE